MILLLLDTWNHLFLVPDFGQSGKKIGQRPHFKISDGKFHNGFSMNGYEWVMVVLVQQQFL